MESFDLRWVLCATFLSPSDGDYCSVKQAIHTNAADTQTHSTERWASRLFWPWLYIKLSFVTKLHLKRHFVVLNPTGQHCCYYVMNIECKALLAYQNVNQMLTKISISPAPVFNKMGQQMSGPDSSNGWSIRHESEGWGFESPSGRDIFCLKKRRHFHKNIRPCVENECCCPRKVNISNVNFT